MKPRQPRSDSITAAVVAAQNAAQAPIEPPVYVTLPEAAKPFWRALMLNRPRDRWNEADLGNAAILAITMMQVHGLLRDVEQAPLVDKLTRRIVLLSRLLHVHAEATVGRPADSAKPLLLEQQARAIEHDDLIPMQ